MQKKNSILKVITFVLALTILLSVPCSSYGQSISEPKYDLEYFLGVMDYIKENYAFEVSDQELLEGAIKGLFYNLDEYSEYYTEEELQMLMEGVSGDFVGIGVYITEKDGYITVVSPIEGSPAEKAGLKPEDKIVFVDGKSMDEISSDEAVSLMKGEKGTKVKLGIKREDKKEILYFDITRDEIKINPVSYKIMDNNIGYIRIAQFNNHVYENLVPVLKEFDKKNISKIIVDLRDNPGGYLDEVVEVSRLFIPNGPIVHIKYKDGTEDTYDSYQAKAKYKLAVLVNEGSASASEIFAGAVQDRKVGTIVGVTTFGKGVVQDIIPLTNGDGIKLTVAEYLTPNRRYIHNKGIVPDIVVQNKDTDKDLQLEKAVQVLNK